MNQEKINVPYMLGEVHSDVKSILTRLDAQNGWMKDHEQRISSVENEISGQKGATRVWSLVIATVTSLFVGLLEYLASKK